MYPSVSEARGYAETTKPDSYAGMHSLVADYLFRGCEGLCVAQNGCKGYSSKVTEDKSDTKTKLSKRND